MFELRCIIINLFTLYSYTLKFLTLIGSPALTSRGLKEDGFEKVISLLDRTIQIAEDINIKSGNCVIRILYIQFTRNCVLDKLVICIVLKLCLNYSDFLKWRRFA